MDPEHLGQDQLAASNSEMASDSASSWRGVGEKEPKSAAFGTCIKPLPCIFLTSTNQRKKEPSSLLKASWIFHRGPVLLSPVV